MDSGKPVAVVSPENRNLDQQQQQQQQQPPPMIKPPPLNPVGSAFGVKGGGIPPPPTAHAPSGPPGGVMIGMSPGRGGPGLLQQQHSTPPRSGAPFASPPPAWPTCVRIEAAPEDVSSADVFDFS